MSANKFILRFSQAQRAIIGVAISLFVILVFLHNPISGYTTEGVTSVFVPEMSSLRGETYTCCDEIHSIDLPFSQWRSNDPLVNWLGYVLNFFFSLISVIAIAAVLIFIIFAREKTES
jgi:hypothetical protein